MRRAAVGSRERIGRHGIGGKRTDVAQPTSACRLEQRGTSRSRAGRPGNRPGDAKTTVVGRADGISMGLTPRRLGLIARPP
jgi:hypothetical protein